MLKQPKRSPDGTRSPYSKVLEDSPSKKLVFPKYVVFGGTVNENSVTAKRVTSVHNNSGSRVAKHRIDEAPFCFLFGGSLAKRDYWQYARWSWSTLLKWKNCKSSQNRRDL